MDKIKWEEIRKTLWKAYAWVRGGCPGPKAKVFPLAGHDGCSQCRLGLQTKCSFTTWALDQLSDEERRRFKQSFGRRVPSDATMRKRLSREVFENARERKRIYYTGLSKRKRTERADRWQVRRNVVTGAVDKFMKAFAKTAKWIETTLAEFLNLVFSMWTGLGIMTATLFGVLALYTKDWVIALVSVPLIVALGWINSQIEERIPPPLPGPEEE